MSLGELYVPSGLALETAQQVLQVKRPHAVNVAWGCPNQCEYCYVPYIKKGCIRYPKHPAHQLVQRQLDPGLKPEAVFLCFATDPFLPSTVSATLKILEMLKQRGIKTATLSKLSGSQLSDIVGFTIVSFDEQYAKKYEPNALDPTDRLKIAEGLKDIGCDVFFSLEPYPIQSMVKQELNSFLYRFLIICYFVNIRHSSFIHSFIKRFKNN